MVYIDGNSNCFSAQNMIAYGYHMDIWPFPTWCSDGVSPQVTDVDQYWWHIDHSNMFPGKKKKHIDFITIHRNTKCRCTTTKQHTIWCGRSQIKLLVVWKEILWIPGGVSWNMWVNWNHPMENLSVSSLCEAIIYVNRIHISIQVIIMYIYIYIITHIFHESLITWN